MNLVFVSPVYSHLPCFSCTFLSFDALLMCNLYVLAVLYKYLPNVIALYTEDDSCIAIETFVSKKEQTSEAKLSSHNEIIIHGTFLLAIPECSIYLF